MTLTACPRCASLDIHGARLRDGLVIGNETQFSVCRGCGLRGQPLLFEDVEAYLAFRRGDEGPVDAGEAPEWLMQEWQDPRRTRRRSPISALFIATLGLGALAVGALLAVAMVGWIVLDAVRAVPTAVATLLGTAIGVALLRIAGRLWRGVEQPETGPQV